MSDTRLCLALDGCLPTEALHWIERTRATFGTYKVGLELFCRTGPSFLAECRAAGAPALFLDLKLHDIPRTVARAVEAVAGPAIRWLTVHAGGGAQMLAEAQAATSGTGTGLLGVTVLTSLDPGSAADAGLLELREVVARRTHLAAAAGLEGIVCSVEEVPETKARFPQMLYVTPGIRWADGPTHDQRRVAEPASALAAGSGLLVIGRMITAAADPVAALHRLRQELT